MHFPSHVYASLIPTFAISTLFGVYPTIPIKNGNRITLATTRNLKLITLIFVALYTTVLGILYREQFSNMSNYYSAKVSKISLQMILLVGILFTYTTYTTSLKNGSAMRGFLERIAEIDDGLKTSINHWKPFWWQTAAIISGFSFLACVIGVQYVAMLRSGSRHLSVATWFCLIFPFPVALSVDYIFVAYSALLMNRFKIINIKLNEMMLRETAVSTCTLTYSFKQYNPAFLKELTHLMATHGGLCELCKQLNAALHLQLLATLVHQFVVVMVGFFNFYWRFNISLHSSLCWLYWGVTSIYEIVLKSYTCHLTAQESKSTVNIVNKLSMMHWGPKINQKLKIFAIHLMHSEVRFSACGLVNFDANLIYMIIGSAVTYTVILVQFQVASSPINCILNVTDNEIIGFENGSL